MRILSPLLVHDASNKMLRSLGKLETQSNLLTAEGGDETSTGMQAVCRSRAQPGGHPPPLPAPPTQQGPPSASLPASEQQASGDGFGGLLGCDC